MDKNSDFFKELKIKVNIFRVIKIYLPLQKTFLLG